MHGAKSIRGSSVMGAEMTQFKGWTIPLMHTVGEDAIALGKTLATLGKSKMTPEQFAEVYRVAGMAAAAMLVERSLGNAKDDEDTFKGHLKHYLRGEIWTSLSWTDMALFLSGGAAAGTFAKLGAHLVQLGAGVAGVESAKFHGGEHDGENKGWAGVKRDITPRFWPKKGGD